jgi:hypothetical protein
LLAGPFCNAIAAREAVRLVQVPDKLGWMGKEVGDAHSVRAGIEGDGCGNWGIGVFGIEMLQRIEAECERPGACSALHDWFV